ncbi:Arp5 protein [Martiniozyma asiatica (nom. inval.)]|nr:Arp5 protein [Martiniozyma asiatica]
MVHFTHVDRYPLPQSNLPTQEVHMINDHPTPYALRPFSGVGYSPNVPIAMDLGRFSMRAGLANQDTPFTFPSITSRFRDKATGKSGLFVGDDVWVESGVIKSCFDELIVNWEMLEKMMDYSFLHLGVNSNGKVPNGLVLTERPVAALSQRKNLEELVFESYDVPKLAFGVDGLFSYFQNGGKNGLVISTGWDDTHIIPVINGQKVLQGIKRINVGGKQLSEWLKWELTLKYPYFPTRLNEWQVRNIMEGSCFVSSDYPAEIPRTLDLDWLEEKDMVWEMPFNEMIRVEKTEEQKLEDEKRRKENVKKLQALAKEKREEKLEVKRKDFEYYSDLKKDMETMTRKEKIDVLREAGFEDEVDLNKYLISLDRSLKRANLGEGEEEEEEKEKYDFSLLDRPNEDLTPDEIKEKKKLRLIKSNIEAKERARIEKEEAKKEAEEAAKKDVEFRLNDLEGWIHQKREKLSTVIKKRKDRQKLKEELGDRKSKASQQRMKNIASLADEAGPKRRHGATIDNDPNDTFGTNDDDWGVYRDIAEIDDEEISEDERETIFKLEVELLEFDDNFTIEDTQERQFDWRKSTVHKFLRGPREFDAEDQHQVHQIHMNVERIRVSEILFQPNIAGNDQAGISEVCEHVIKRLPQELGFSGDNNPVDELLKDIFVTGSLGKMDGFDTRIKNDLTQVLPQGQNINVRVAKNPELDAWKGMCRWSETADKWLTKKEWEESGPDYLWENEMSCVPHL